MWGLWINRCATDAKKKLHKKFNFSRLSWTSERCVCECIIMMPTRKKRELQNMLEKCGFVLLSLFPHGIFKIEQLIEETSGKDAWIERQKAKEQRRMCQQCNAQIYTYTHSKLLTVAAAASD